DAGNAAFLGPTEIMACLTVCTDQKNPPDVVEAQFLDALRVVAIGESLLDRKSHGEIVGDTTVQEVDVLGLFRIQVQVRKIGQLALAREILGLASPLYPEWLLSTAPVSVVLQCDWSKYDWKAVGCSDGVGDGIGG